MNKIIDLGIHPFADTFINKKQYGLSEDFGRIQAKMFWDKSPYRREEE